MDYRRDRGLAGVDGRAVRADLLYVRGAHLYLVAAWRQCLGELPVRSDLHFRRHASLMEEGHDAGYRARLAALRRAPFDDQLAG